MLSALLRAGRSLTAGLSYLSTADSILMSYPKLPGQIVEDSVAWAMLRCPVLCTKRPAGGLFNLYPLTQGPARCTLEAYVPRLITSPSS